METQHSSTLPTAITVYLIKEGNQYVAIAPSLDVSSYGDSVEEATAAVTEAIEIFIEETTKRGTFESELLKMGWTLSSQNYLPPVDSPYQFPLPISRLEIHIPFPLLHNNTEQAE